MPRLTVEPITAGPNRKIKVSALNPPLYQAEAGAVAPDVSGNRIREVTSDNQRLSAGEPLDEIVSRDAGLIRIEVGARSPAGIGDLTWVMHHVTSDHGRLTM
jgi:hypothetical protein